MSPVLFLQIATIVSDLVIFFFVGFYLWRLTKDRKKLDQKEKLLAEKEAKLTSEYEKIIEGAHQKEREILNNATQKANQILKNTEYAAESVKESLDNNLQQVVARTQEEASSSSEAFVGQYKTSLENISQNSLKNFETITGRFEVEMDAQIKQFRESMLANIQSELQEYKQDRLNKADKKIGKLINEVSQKVLNKALSYDDHKDLIIRSLEKSRMEGVFD